MATSVLPIMSYRSGTVSSTTDQPNAVSYLTVRQSGRVVTINGYVRDISFTANTNTNVVQISGVDLPASSSEIIRFPVNIADQAYNPGVLGVGAFTENGYIRVSSPATATGRNITFSISYIV